jgi:CubicO group peptidase (beta-lactamase class C family)
MAPAGQLWSTVGDLVTWGQFLAGSRPDLLAPSTLAEMSRPVDESYGLGLRLSANAGGVLIGHTGSMPGFLAALYVDPGSGIGGVVLTNGTTGIDPEQLVMELIDGDFVDDLPEPWRPTLSVPGEVDGLPGLWFWGNSALELRWHNDGLDLRSLAVPEREPERFELADGRLVGVAGYHRGESLHVHRRSDGTINHLECATFVYTRTPYDPEAPIPGGVPRRPG